VPITEWNRCERGPQDSRKHEQKPNVKGGDVPPLGQRERESGPQLVNSSPFVASGEGSRDTRLMVWGDLLLRAKRKKSDG